MQLQEGIARPRRFAIDRQARHFLAQPALHDLPLLAGITLLLASGIVLGLINLAAIVRLAAALIGA
jgi:hypothetical protein